MRWHLVVVGFLVSILACSSSGGSGNGPGTGSRDGGTTADGSSTAELDGAADPDGSMVDRPTDEPVVECVDEATRTSALASDAYCAGCGCATCDAGAGVRPGEMTLKDAPSDFCPPEASAEVMTGFLQQARKKLVASSPLTRVLDIRDVAATKFREISAKAAASTLTDADIVSALATFRSAESELVTLRTDFEEKCNRFKIDAWWTGDVTFTRWYGGKELGSDCIWDAVTGREACPKDRVKYARALEVRVARAVGFYEEMYAFGHLEDVPLTTQLLGVRETELLGTNYGTMRRKLADARSADADVKAQALKADPEVAPQVGDITQVLKEKPSFEEVKYSVDTYRDFATRKSTSPSSACGVGSRRCRSRAPTDCPTSARPPTSVFLTLNELLRRYYDSDEWKRAVLLFSETADQLLAKIEKETLMDEDIAVLVKNDDEAERSSRRSGGTCSRPWNFGDDRLP
ncbi:MAG: hypothetical protein U0169_02745 [Polyangiaceae bacterium]